MHYDERVLRALVPGSAPRNRLLIDCDFEVGDEPIKVCVRNGVPLEPRQQAEIGC